MQNRTQQTLLDAIQTKVDSKTKPLGSLGKLEKIAKQVATIQNSLEPKISFPECFLFAGDHGITEESVSAYPKEVTWQMVLNFLQGGAASSVFAKHLGIGLQVVDMGVDYDFDPERLPVFSELIPKKIRKSTHNFLREPAMTTKEVLQGLQFGKEVIWNHSHPKSNFGILGEMGIGNTSSASLLLHGLTGLPLEDLVGRGTGLPEEKLVQKFNVLNQSLERGGNPSDPIELLAEYGGFEIVGMVGAYLALAEKKSTILVDGWISTAAFFLASKLEPSILEYALFAHTSGEKGHKLVLDYFGEEPLLDLQMRLGEGTGALAAYPLVQLSLAFFNEMASFEEAKVAKEKTGL